MAEIYRVTPKTFKKYVVEYDLPFEPLGKAKLFDLAKVENRLAQIAEEMKVPEIDLSSIRGSKRKITIESEDHEKDFFERELGLRD